MSSIRNDRVALDANEWIFGLSRRETSPSSVILVRERAAELRLFLPLQVVVEVRRSLGDHAMRELYRILRRAREFSVSYEDAIPEMRERYLRLGAKKGDAAICAQLEAAGVRWLVSENRHFLSEMPELPFAVLTAEETLRALE